MPQKTQDGHIQTINGWKFKYHYSHSMKCWLICIVNENGVQVTGAKTYQSKELLIKDYPQLNFK